jgi:hypothetical protein
MFHKRQKLARGPGESQMDSDTLVVSDDERSGEVSRGLRRAEPRPPRRCARKRVPLPRTRAP